MARNRRQDDLADWRGEGLESGGGRRRAGLLRLGLSLLLLMLAAAGVAWWKTPPLEQDPLALLARSPEVDGLGLWLAGADDLGTLWLVVEGAENDDSVAEGAEMTGDIESGPEEALARLQERWRAEGRWPGVEVQSSAELLQEYLAELVAWSWLVAPAAEREAMVASLGSEAATAARLQAAVDELRYGLPGQELIAGARDPLGLRKAELLAREGALAAAGGAEEQDAAVGLLRLRAGSVEEARALMRELPAELEQSPEVGWREWGVTGEVAYAQEIETTMRRDVRASVMGTTVEVLLLFWLLVGRLRGLVEVMLPVLAACLGAWLTLSLGFARMHPLTAGCGALLLGLVSDYAVVGRAEAVTGASRWNGGRGILWSTLATGMVFCSLWATGVPGLGQFGVLVAAGLLAGALMVLGPLWTWWLAAGRAESGLARRMLPWGAIWCWGRWPVGLALLGAVGLLGVRGWPGLELGGGMTAAGSRADWALARLGGSGLGEAGGGAGDDAGSEVGLRRWLVRDRGQLAAVEAELAAAQRRGELTGFSLASPWLGDERLEEVERARAQLRALAGQAGRLEEQVRAAGFAASAWGFDARVLALWAGAEKLPLPEFLAGRVLRDGDGLAAVLELRGAEASLVAPAGVVELGWERVRLQTLERVLGYIRVWGGWLALGLVGIAWLALRRWAAVGLVVLSLAASGLLLLGMRAGLGWGWTPFALATLPLLLGVGLDFPLHLLLAARREAEGEEGALRRTAQALAFCWATALSGFVALAWAQTPPLRELGRAGALGMLAIGLVVLVGLPGVLRRRNADCGMRNQRGRRPRAGF